MLKKMHKTLIDQFAKKQEKIYCDSKIKILYHWRKYVKRRNERYERELRLKPEPKQIRSKIADYINGKAPINEISGQHRRI